MTELGLKGWATLKRIAPCPEIASAAGRAVTSTLTHSSAEVYELKVVKEKREKGSCGLRQLPPVGGQLGGDVCAVACSLG
jgi:hypothetical protein